MSPEQAKRTDADARSDIYAVGIMLFEMLAGRRPFMSSDAVEVLRMQILGPPPLLSDIVPDPSRLPSVDVAIGRSLEKDPARRFSSARDFATALAGSKVILAPAIRSAPFLVPSRLGRGLARLRLMAGEVRTSALHTWRGLPRGGKMSAVVALAATIVVLIAPAVILDRTESHPTRSSASSAEPDRSLDTIQQEIRSGQLAEARAPALSAMNSKSERGRAAVLFGSIEFLDQRVESGLAAYVEAFRKDPSLGTDAALLRNAAVAANDVRYAATAVRVLEAAGKPACDYLASLAWSEERIARQAARAACLHISCDPDCPAPELRPPRPHSDEGPERGGLFGRSSR